MCLQPSNTVRPSFRAALSLTLLSGILLATSPTNAVDRSLVHRPMRSELPPGNFAVVQNMVADPTGDTLGSTNPQIDITSLAVNLVGTNLVIELGFAGPISPAGSGQSNALDGFIDLDTDQNGATGRLPWIDALTGQLTSGMGTEYYLDLITYDPDHGTIDLFQDSSETVIGPVPATFGNNSLRIDLPIALLGDDGAVNLAAVVGTEQELPTDVAPNNGSVASTIPDTVFTLGDGRFSVEIEWQDFEGTTGFGRQVVGSSDSAVAYFFTPDNWEILIKAIDGCAFNDHHWIFLSASTNVEYTITVTDTATGATKQYFNPLGRAAEAVVDTEAFATCP